MIVKQSRLYELVAAQIRGLAASGDLSVGQRLPSEREMATRFGVSRVVIREAVKILRSEGLVDIRRGSGTFLCEPTANHVSEAWRTYLQCQRDRGSFARLLEVRAMLEVEIAGLAALRASDADCASLGTHIDDMERHRNNAIKYAESDQAFHVALAAVTGNELFEALFLPLSGMLQDFRLFLYSHDRDRTVREGLEQHRAILHAVQRGDQSDARRAMHEHVQRSRENFIAASDDTTGATEVGRRHGEEGPAHVGTS
jgi:GntR family transcriptional regulator, transcriptional repressor for pyruvate dehydrogenase complex